MPVPAGLGPGDVFNFKFPARGGQIFEAHVPDGYMPGQDVDVQVPVGIADGTVPAGFKGNVETLTNSRQAAQASGSRSALSEVAQLPYLQGDKAERLQELAQRLEAFNNKLQAKQKPDAVSSTNSMLQSKHSSMSSMLQATAPVQAASQAVDKAVKAAMKQGQATLPQASPEDRLLAEALGQTSSRLLQDASKMLNKHDEAHNEQLTEGARHAQLAENDEARLQELSELQDEDRSPRHLGRGEEAAQEKRQLEDQVNHS